MSFSYLATPYSKYPGGIEAAHREACRAAAMLVKAGVGVYSPIAHTHPIAIYGGIDPLNHDIWLPADTPMMQAASSITVVKMKGWQESVGVAHEIKAFQEMGKPVFYMEWVDEGT